jgi:hypothetical protein
MNCNPQASFGPIQAIVLAMFFEDVSARRRGKFCRWVKRTRRKMQKAECEHPAFFDSCLARD